MTSSALKGQGVVIGISAETGSPNVFVTIGEVVDFTGPGGSATVIDVTSLESSAVDKLIGLPDEGQISMSLNLLPSNEGQRECWEARAAQELREFNLTLTDAASTVLVFSGYVLEFSVSGAVNDKISATITVEISGLVTGFPAPT